MTKNITFAQNKVMLIIAVAFVVLISSIGATFVLTRDETTLEGQAKIDAEKSVVTAEQAAVSARKAAGSTKTTADFAEKSANDSAVAAKAAAALTEKPKSFSEQK